MTTLTHVRRAQTDALTREELTAELERQQAAKRDYVVDTRRMTFTSAENNQSVLAFDVPVGAALLEQTESPGVDGGVVKDHAHNQIAQRLNIPRKYYDRMREKAPSLLDTNVQHWFHQEPETRLVRMLDGQVRALLSNRYRRLDNIDLLVQAIVPTFRNHPDLTFQVAALTDERMTIRALLPSLEREIRRGDVVQAGVEWTNSEVGKAALKVQPFAWRLICLNGMVAVDYSLSRYHIGREQEEQAYAVYQDDTLAADDQAFFLKARDMSNAALSEVTFDKIVAEMRAAATGTPVQNPVSATERLAQRFQLTEEETGTVLRAWASDGDMTRWGAVNALTQAAKSADSFTRQQEIETLGGVLLAAPEQEWAAVAA